MCDPALVWERGQLGEVEVWLYYASPNTKVESWAGCLADQGQEFIEKNYSQGLVGVWAR